MLTSRHSKRLSTMVFPKRTKLIDSTMLAIQWQSTCDRRYFHLQWPSGSCPISQVLAWNDIRCREMLTIMLGLYKECATLTFTPDCPILTSCNTVQATICWLFLLCWVALPCCGWSIVWLVWHLPISERFPTGSIWRTYPLSLQLFLLFWGARGNVKWCGSWIHQCSC